MTATVAVVLAGGESRRFGSDKLAADLGGMTLLDRAVGGLPNYVDVLVVGPERPLGRPAQFVREDPPGGGPSAALAAGLTAALARGAEVLLVLPGDTPEAGQAVAPVLAALATSAVSVAVDGDGRAQPLQLALTAAGARSVLTALGPHPGGRSVRAVLSGLHPPPRPVAVPSAALRDVDTPTDLATAVASAAQT